MASFLSCVFSLSLSLVSMMVPSHRDRKHPETPIRRPQHKEGGKAGSAVLRLLVFLLLFAFSLGLFLSVSISTHLIHPRVYSLQEKTAYKSPLLILLLLLFFLFEMRLKRARKRLVIVCSLPSNEPSPASHLYQKKRGRRRALCSSSSSRSLQRPPPATHPKHSAGLQPSPTLHL